METFQGVDRWKLAAEAKRICHFSKWSCAKWSYAFISESPTQKSASGESFPRLGSCCFRRACREATKDYAVAAS
jgi:hypothetical protein